MRFSSAILKSSLVNVSLIMGGIIIVFVGLELILRKQYQPDLAIAYDGVYALGATPGLPDAFKWDGKGNSLAHIRSDNPIMVYELRPSTKLREHITINSFGFRDYEYNREKPENVYRICVLGDSITFGWMERMEDTYPKVLERLMNANRNNGTKFEVWNMGISGYNAEQEMELFRTRVLNFKPDMLILGYCINDSQIGADSGLWRHFTRSGSLAWDWISLRWLQARELWHRESLLQRSYRRIAELAKQNDVLVTAAFFYPPNPNEYCLEIVSEDLKLSKNLGFIVVDLLAPFEKHGWEQTMNDGIHPNARGHEIAGQVIFDRLSETGLLPLNTDTSG